MRYYLDIKCFLVSTWSIGISQLIINIRGDITVCKYYCTILVNILEIIGITFNTKERYKSVDSDRLPRCAEASNCDRYKRPLKNQSFLIQRKKETGRGGYSSKQDLTLFSLSSKLTNLRSLSFDTRPKGLRERKRKERRRFEWRDLHVKIRQRSARNL